MISYLAPSASASDETIRQINKGPGEIVFSVGEYVFDKQVNLLDVSNIRFSGVPGTVLKSQVPGGSIFYLGDKSRNISWRDLEFKGRGPYDARSGAAEAAIVGASPTEVSIENCKFTGFGGNVLYFYSPKALRIKGNDFWNNEVKTWDSGSIQNGDITVYATAEKPARDIVVTENRCQSNNRCGIILYGVAGPAVVTSNIVHSRMDFSLEDPVRSEDFRRKDGITLVYYNDNDSQFSWDIICNSNIVRNCAWSGIYLAGSSVTQPFNYNTDGPYVTINGNIVSYSCMNIQSKNNSRLQAGISLRGLQAASVCGNVVHHINANDTAPASHPAAGIRLYENWIYSGNPESRVCLDGNVFKNIKGPEIDKYVFRGKFLDAGNLI